MPPSPADTGGLAALVNASAHAWGVPPSPGTPPPVSAPGCGVPSKRHASPEPPDGLPPARLAPATKRHKATTPERIALLDARQARNRLSSQASCDTPKDCLSALETQHTEPAHHPSDPAQSNLTPANKRPKAMTPERIARLEARQARNRLSAQASRDKKKNYVSTLEARHTELARHNSELWRKAQDYESRFHAISSLVVASLDPEERLRQISLCLPALVPGNVDPTAIVGTSPTATVTAGADASAGTGFGLGVGAKTSGSAAGFSSPNASPVSSSASTIGNCNSQAAGNPATKRTGSPAVSPSLATTKPAPAIKTEAEAEAEAEANGDDANGTAQSPDVEDGATCELSARLPAVKAVPSSGRSLHGDTAPITPEIDELCPSGANADADANVAADA